ncbi:hypothetical protein ACHQM5_021358 [Ranunculus cassubicifolius]
MCLRFFVSLCYRFPRSNSSPRYSKSLATKCSVQNGRNSSGNKDVVRQHFHPSVWKDHDFVPSSICNSNLKAERVGEGRLEQLKKEVKNIFFISRNNPTKELELIDKMQQLGVAYHFEAEIQDRLQAIYNDNHISEDCTDLYVVALRFRLLREAGYYVSSDVFEKFRDTEGGFHSSIASDIKAMLSLYEASLLSFIGEDILDEATTFTRKHLSSMVTHQSSQLASEIERTLDIPLHKRVDRIHAKHYISIYEQEKSRNKNLLEFAKFDYNAVQLLHQKSISEAQWWWDSINIKSKLPFDIRDRVVEAYAVVMNINPEPQCTLGTIHLTKLWCILSVLDDAFDVHGVLDELEPLCDALQRWDAEGAKGLTEHMKVIFDEVLNLFNEIESDMMRKGHLIGIPYFKKHIQSHAKNLFEEAKILFSKDLPTLEEWLSIATLTAGIHPFIVVAVMNLEEQAKKDVFDWILSMPDFIINSSLLIRLLDDIASFKVERERGINVSIVPLYMKKNGVSESEAIDSLRKKITTTWKVVNQEYMGEKHVPLQVRKIIMNFNRTIALFYISEDGHTVSNGRTKEIITSLLIDPIPTLDNAKNN